LIVAAALLVRGQIPTQSPKPGDDVVRVNTELVQTDVMVFDRRGNFVDGLRPEQFIVTLNGVKRSVQLLNRVTTGSRSEAAQLSASRSGTTATTPKDPNRAAIDSSRGRVLYFFVDDLHLSAEGVERCRKALLNFVDTRINPDDQVAIVSASGQIGFLQQLTDNPVVMHTAINRLSYKKNPETTAGKTRITEYMASQVQDANNKELFAYLMDSVKVEFGMGVGALRGSHSNDSAGQARRLLKSRIGQITFQTRADALNTLHVLQTLMESSAAIPGRKLVFLLSDGFVVDPRGSSALDLLRKVTSVAARTGAVIYTMDTRGLFAESNVDASNNDFVDMTSRHAGLSLGETMEPREPLSIMAAETGGRAIFNSSSIDKSILQAVDETSEYYVLAWRPDRESERKGSARVEIAVEGRPDLRVRLRRTYLTVTDDQSTKSKPQTVKTPEAELLSTLGSSYAQRNLPRSLSIGYTKASASEFNLQASMQIDRDAIRLDPGKEKTEIDVIGAAIDDRGLIYSFKQVLNVVPQPELKETPVIWTQKLSVRPGLYQVRVAVRERASGRTGSAMQWIEIPTGTSEKLVLSSLFLGERRGDLPSVTLQGPKSIRVDVDHRFARSSVLRFQTYVYNAASPEIWIDAQIFQGRQSVMTISSQKLPTGTTRDQASLPYWSEISLAQLPPGSYTLQLVATERPSQRTAQQRTNFIVE